MHRLLRNLLLAALPCALPGCEVRWDTGYGGGGGGGSGGGGGGGGTTHAIGGMVQGLTTGSLVLQLNGGDPYEVWGDGPFVMPERLPPGAGYTVSVMTAPAGFSATATHASGTIGGDVSDIVITVARNVFSVGGTVTGLHGTLELDNALIERITITADGPFTFPTVVADGSPFSVTIWNGPPDQICTVTNGTGSVSGADVTDVVVTCTDKYRVGGTATGLTAPITLQNNGGDDIMLGADTAFTFPQALVDASPYAVTVTAGTEDQRCVVTDGSGVISGADVTNVAVTCAPKVWTKPASFADNISPDGALPVGGVRIAADRDGNAIVVWQQNDGTDTQIFKSEFRSGAWTHPASLADNISPDGEPAAWPDVAMSDDGTAIVVWQQSDGTDTQIFKSEFRAGAWTHPANLADNISPDGEPAQLPRVAMDEDGNALVVWQQNDGTRQRIFKSEFRAGAWTHPAALTDAISPAVGADATGAVVAMADGGDALVAWRHDDGMGAGRILKSEYRAGAWAHPASLGDAINPTGDGLRVRLAINAGGAALIVWYQWGGAHNQVFKSEYRAGAWTHPSALTDNVSPDGQHATNPEAALDDAGDAIVVWPQFDGTNTRMFKSEYRAGAWTHPASLTDSFGPVSAAGDQPDVVIGAGGRTIVAWPQAGPTHRDIFVSVYRAGAWTHPASTADHLSPTAGPANQPRVALSPSGDAIIVWSQLDATLTATQVFKSEYR